ncbi:hypothetical protein [Mucilaginibacter sp.]|uniref:hypothetical protein n=1 Tax=Mucilaginibacter sp. TaxID=1882438 RepID=UPI0026020772|nr:hypothetical protein [Mucilaginibacter sp.]
MSDKMDETSNLVKKVIKLWPVFSFFGMILGGIIGFVWGVFVYNASLVKRPEYEDHLKIENGNTKAISRSLIIDSTTNYSQDQRLEKLETAPKWRLTRVIHVKDKNGISRDREVN